MEDSAPPVTMSPVAAAAATVMSPAATDYKRESATARLLGSGTQNKFAFTKIAADMFQAPLVSPS